MVSVRTPALNDWCEGGGTCYPPSVRHESSAGSSPGLSDSLRTLQCALPLGECDRFRPLSSAGLSTGNQPPPPAVKSREASGIAAANHCRRGWFIERLQGVAEKMLATTARVGLAAPRLPADRARPPRDGRSPGRTA